MDVFVGEVGGNTAARRWSLNDLEGVFDGKGVGGVGSGASGDGAGLGWFADVWWLGRIVTWFGCMCMRPRRRCAVASAGGTVSVRGAGRVTGAAAPAAPRPGSTGTPAIDQHPEARRPQGQHATPANRQQQRYVSLLSFTRWRGPPFWEPSPSSKATPRHDSYVTPSIRYSGPEYPQVRAVPTWPGIQYRNIGGVAYSSREC